MGKHEKIPNTNSHELNKNEVVPTVLNEQDLTLEIENMHKEIDAFSEDEVLKNKQSIEQGLSGLGESFASEKHASEVLNKIKNRVDAFVSKYRHRVALLAVAVGSFGAVKADPGTKTATKAETPISAPVKMDTLSSDHGHLEYNDIAGKDLIEIAPGKKLNKEAVPDYKKMVAAAAKDGIKLFPVSSFRSHHDQENNFYGKMKARHITADSMSKAVAPPGHSEHHTGDAIDFNSLEQTFESTKEFKWMQEHAAEYNFEISFTKDNKQGVMYEPWHWRWVGNSTAKHDLYRDKAYVVKDSKGKMYVRDSVKSSKQNESGPGIVSK